MPMINGNKLNVIRALTIINRHLGRSLAIAIVDLPEHVVNLVVGQEKAGPLVQQQFGMTCRASNPLQILTESRLRHPGYLDQGLQAPAKDPSSS